ncbi:MAG TPA: hypothetical protein DIS75_08305 [Chryseobacterium sp.]|nr:hypothetical protein [Chryseobacterium sp.]HQD44752.1 helix-turn-helix domain-containing protein [Kaistella sp.]
MENTSFSHTAVLPAEDFKFLVFRYHFFKTGNDDGKWFTEKHIPDGFASITFNFNLSIGAVINDVEKFLPEVYLTLPHLGFVKVFTKPNADVMIVSAKASVVSKIFDLNLSNAPNGIYYFEDPVWKKKFGELKPITSHDERIRIFEKFILNTLHEVKYQEDEIDCAYDGIFKNEGLLSVKNLAEISFTTERTLRRNFKNRVGVSPKTMIRIVRFNKLWHKVQNDLPIDYQDLCFYGDFYDQSHFIHEVERITGENPSDFFGKNLDLVKLMSGF